MVKRLIDEECLESMDSIDGRLAALFRAAPRFEMDPFRKRRVLVSLERMHARTLPRSRFWLKPAVAAGLLVSGTATAAIGHRYVTHGTGFFGFGPAVAGVAGQPAAPRAPTPHVVAPVAAHAS